jgi:hypothetical protein
MKFMLWAVCAIPLYADSVFLTGDVTVGTNTTFSDTNNGVTATFSSSADPGGFTVTSGFAGLSEALFDPGPANASNIPLDIGFDATLDSFNVDFVTDGPGEFDLGAYLGGALVGTASAVGSDTSGLSISFAGDFDSIVLTSPSTPYFAIGNIDVAPANAPEPSYALIFPLVGFGLVMLNRRRNATRN